MLECYSRLAMQVVDITISVGQEFFIAVRNILFGTGAGNEMKENLI